MTGIKQQANTGNVTCMLFLSREGLYIVMLNMKKKNMILFILQRLVYSKFEYVGTVSLVY